MIYTRLCYQKNIQDTHNIESHLDKIQIPIHNCETILY